MNKQKVIGILCVGTLLISAFVSGCGSNNTDGETIISDNGGGLKRAQTPTDADTASNTYYINEPIVCDIRGDNLGESSIEYTVYKIEFLDTIDMSQFAWDTFYTPIAEIYVETSGKLKEDMTFIVLHIKAKALKCPDESSVLGKDEHMISTLRLYSDETFNFPVEPSYFKLNETTDIRRSSESAEYYHFILPKDQTADMQVGFFASKEVVEKGTLFLAFGDNPELYKYLPLKSSD